MNRRFSIKYYYVVTFIFVFGFGFCGANAEVIEWNPRWNVGDQFTVELVKERKDGKAVANKGRVLLDMSIQEKGKDYYIVHVTYGKFELEGPQKNNPLVSRMMNLSEGLRLEIKTGEDGMPQELLNINQVVAHMKKGIDILEEFLKENKLPQMMIDQIITPVREIYKKNESVQSAALDEIMLFFLFCGAELELGNAVEFDELLPNPFQGEALPGKGTILLKEFDKQTGIAVVEYRLTIDKEKAAPIIFAALQKRAPQSAPAPKKEEMPQLDVSDRSLYRIDAKKGWALSVEHSRDIKANGEAGRVQSMLFKTVRENDDSREVSPLPIRTSQ